MRALDTIAAMAILAGGIPMPKAKGKPKRENTRAWRIKRIQKQLEWRAEIEKNVTPVMTRQQRRAAERQRAKGQR